MSGANEAPRKSTLRRRDLRRLVFVACVAVGLSWPLDYGRNKPMRCGNTVVFLEAPSPHDPSEMLDIPVAMLAYFRARGVSSERLSILVTSVSEWRSDELKECRSSRDGDARAPVVIGPSRSSDIASVELPEGQTHRILVSATVTDAGVPSIDVVGDNLVEASAIAKCAELNHDTTLCYWDYSDIPGRTLDPYRADLVSALQIPKCTGRADTDCSPSSRRNVVAIGHPTDVIHDYEASFAKLCVGTMYLTDAVANTSVVRALRTSEHPPNEIFSVRPRLQRDAPEDVARSGWFWGRGVYAWLRAHCGDGRCDTPSGLLAELERHPSGLGYVCEAVR